MGGRGLAVREPVGVPVRVSTVHSTYAEAMSSNLVIWNTTALLTMRPVEARRSRLHLESTVTFLALCSS